MSENIVLNILTVEGWTDIRLYFPLKYDLGDKILRIMFRMFDKTFYGVYFAPIEILHHCILMDSV